MHSDLRLRNHLRLSTRRQLTALAGGLPPVDAGMRNLQQPRHLVDLEVGAVRCHQHESFRFAGTNAK